MSRYQYNTIDLKALKDHAEKIIENAKDGVVRISAETLVDIIDGLNIAMGALEVMSSDQTFAAEALAKLKKLGIMPEPEVQKSISLSEN